MQRVELAGSGGLGQGGGHAVSSLVSSVRQTNGGPIVEATA